MYNDIDTDLLIIGAGPAGLTAAQYGARLGLRAIAVEQFSVGGQALLIDNLENYPGNIAGDGKTQKSGFEISQDMRRQAENFGAKCITGTVTGLKKTARSEESIFEVTLGNKEILSALAVIIATGTKHRTLDIPGEAQFYGRGVSYCATCDGPFFKNKKIFVIGGGDSACDEAQYLSRLSQHVVMIHRRDKLRAQQISAERVLGNPHISVRFSTKLLEIKGDQKVASVVLEHTDKEGKTSISEESADAVFVFVGAAPQVPHGESGEKIEGLKTDESGYIITNQRMETTIPGLFAAGDARATAFRQVVVAAAEGAIAAHCADEFIEALL